MRNVLFAVFDRTGNISEPYRNDPNWEVIQIDIQAGEGREAIDFLQYDYQQFWYDHYDYGKGDYVFPSVGIIMAIPCDNYALCGSKHFARKDADGTTVESQRLVDRAHEMITFFQSTGKLKFWQLENPRTRIHKLNPWIGKIRQRFNPTEMAGHSPEPDNDRYNKDTWLFGDFNKMIPSPMDPFTKDNPGWRNLGGKSLRTKNLRSISPKGYCYAFYKENH